jgi:hypothetical protein
MSFNIFSIKNDGTAGYFSTTDCGLAFDFCVLEANRRRSHVLRASGAMNCGSVSQGNRIQVS